MAEGVPAYGEGFVGRRARDAVAVHEAVKISGPPDPHDPLGGGVGFRDLLHALDADSGDLQGDPGGPAGHVDRRPPSVPHLLPDRLARGRAVGAVVHVILAIRADPIAPLQRAPRLPHPELVTGNAVWTRPFIGTRQDDVFAGLRLDDAAGLGLDAIEDGADHRSGEQDRSFLHRYAFLLPAFFAGFSGSGSLFLGIRNP